MDRTARSLGLGPGDRIGAGIYGVAYKTRMTPTIVGAVTGCQHKMGAGRWPANGTDVIIKIQVPTTQRGLDDAYHEAFVHSYLHSLGATPRPIQSDRGVLSVIDFVPAFVAWAYDQTTGASITVRAVAPGVTLKSRV